MFSEDRDLIPSGQVRGQGDRRQTLRDPGAAFPREGQRLGQPALCGRDGDGLASRWIDAIRRLARASELKPLVGEMPKGSAQAVLDEATVILPLAEVIDLGTERLRLAKERDKAAGEASKLAQKLDNVDFVRRAPEEVVEENRERLATAQAEVARLEAALLRIG